jgi:hypothetical protein
MYTVSLKRKIGNTWQMFSGKTLLVEFSVFSSIEALDYARSWLSSFGPLEIELVVPDECNIPKDSEETRVP